MNLCIACNTKEKLDFGRVNYTSGKVWKGKIPILGKINLPAFYDNWEGFRIGIKDLRLPTGIDYECNEDNLPDGEVVILSRRRVSKNDDEHPQMALYQKRIQYNPKNYLYVTIYLPNYIFNKELEVILS